MLRRKKFLTEIYGHLRSESAYPYLWNGVLLRLLATKKDPCDKSPGQGKTVPVSESSGDSKDEYEKRYPPCKPAAEYRQDQGRKVCPGPTRPYSDPCSHVIKPCLPTNRARDPKVQPCGKGSLMDDLPQPDCGAPPPPKRGLWSRILFLLGLLLAGGALYKLYDQDQEDKKKDEEPKVSKSDKKKSRKREIIKVPASSAEIPGDVPYLLIGGGTASYSAAQSIMSNDSAAKILMVTNEPYFPYKRPPLSKELFYTGDRKMIEKLEYNTWTGSHGSLYYEDPKAYIPCNDLMDSNSGMAVALGWTVKKVDVYKKEAYLEDGKVIKYNKCLIATGSSPRTLPVFEDVDDDIKERVYYYKSINDFQEIDEIVEKGAKSIAIIGGGFLGSELACALAHRGKSKGLQVTQIYRENGNMEKILPAYLCEWTTRKVEEEGVKVVKNSRVEDAVMEKKNVVTLLLDRGEPVTAEHVIVAVGAEPNTELAFESELEVDEEMGGFLVNAELEARSHLYAAGDCACFYDVKLGRRRVEHQDQAIVTGTLAGENMTGKSEPYLHQSMFWSDLGPQVGYEAIGLVDSSLPTVGIYAKSKSDDNPRAEVTDTDQPILEDKDDPTRPDTPSPPRAGDDYGKGVIFYLRDDVVVGIVLWNIFNKMNIARKIIKDERKYEDLNEIAKRFSIHK